MPSRKEYRQLQQKTTSRLNIPYEEINPEYIFIRGKTKKETINLQKEALRAQYKKLAKRADQRLVRLEKLRLKPDYKGIDKFAYGKAMRDIRELFGPDAKRFNLTTKDLTISQLESRINRVLEFINAPTSQKKYIDKIYNERFKKLKKEYGVTKSQAMDVFERELIDKYETKLFNSSLMLKIVGKQKSNKRDFDKFISKAVGKNIHTNKDTELMLKDIKEMLETEKLSEEQLLLYLNDKE